MQVDDFQGFDDGLSQHFGRINTGDTENEHSGNRPPYKYVLQITEEERKERIEKQRRENKWHRFVQDNLILKMGLIDKRKVRLRGLHPLDDGDISVRV